MSTLRATCLCIGIGIGLMACAGEAPMFADSGERSLVCAIASSGPDDPAQGEPRTSLDAFSSGALLGELARMNQAPIACSASVSEGIIRSRHNLRGGGALSADIDPRIGYASYRLDGVILSTADAVRLLQLMERDQLGSTGCDVDWPAVSGRHSQVSPPHHEDFAGQVCSCAGYVDSDAVGITGLGFHSAC